MTKHQRLHRVILVAGTIMLAACPGGAPAECQTNEETGEAFCNGGSVTDVGSPASTVTNHPDYDTDN